MQTTIVNPQKLMNAANSFQSQYQKVNNTTQEILNMVNRLNSGVWAGEARNIYANKIQKLSGDISQMRQKINEHISDLKIIAQEYSTAEESAKSSSSSLSGDYIP